MLKKIALIIGIVAIGIIFGGLNAEASTYSKSELIRDNSYMYGLGVNVYGNTVYVIAISHSTGTKYYLDSNDNIVGRGFTLYSSSNPDADFTLLGSFGVNGNVDIGIFPYSKMIYSSYDIYSDSTYTQKVFRVPPPPYVAATMSGVEELPQTMKGTLVDGGLLSVALKVLAILLGVSLVVRWVYLFVRSKS